MTERKPSGMPWRSWVERQIEDAAERGAFERLPGEGKPLPGLDRPHDDLWWIKDKLRREDMAVLPPAVRIRKDIEEARAHIATARTETEVRTVLGELNARIVRLNAYAHRGPPSSVMPLDVEREVELWRSARDGDDRPL